MWWTSSFPIDRWWRKKHEVAFGSKEHFSSSRIDMTLEYVEDKIFEEISKKSEEESKDGFTEEEDNLLNKVTNTESFWKKGVERKEVKLTEEEFDKLDLSQFDDIKDGSGEEV